MLFLCSFIQYKIIPLSIKLQNVSSKHSHVNQIANFLLYLERRNFRLTKKSGFRVTVFINL